MRWKSMGLWVVVAIGVFSGIGLLGPGSVAKAQTPERKYLLERVDDVAVVQLYVDGFDALPLRDKVLLYHLSNAAVAGRDIYIDQKYEHSLVIRDVIEEVLTHANGIDAESLAHVRKYAKLFWVNNGPHSSLTSQKNVMGGTPQAFLEAVKKAVANGAKLPVADGETVDQLIGKLNLILFDPRLDSHATMKSPEPGTDILEASRNNLYRNVRVPDLSGFVEKYPLNSQLVKRPDGKLEERVYRAGFDDKVSAGVYAKQLSEVIAHLEAAIPYATPKMARALGALIHYYRTGEEIDFREYNVAWVDDKDSPVDTINGFIEVYLDARGQKGSWEAVVFFNDPEKMNMITAFAKNAQWFEDNMPYDQQYRKPKVKGISAKAIQVVMETGDAGPVTPIGINLPNAADIRKEYGSKSVSLSNVIEASDRSGSPASRREFCFDDAEFERSEKWKSLALALEVNMHEVIGHASGQESSALRVSSPVAIGEYYSALEEGRADLVALWFIGDPKLIELGLVANAQDLKEIQLAAYEEYTRNAMVQLRRIKTGSTIEEDHMRNRQMIVSWLAANTNAIDVSQRDGKTYYRVRDVNAWHEGIGKLLREVQRIKSEGDRPAAQRLMETHAIRINQELRDEVLRRFASLDRPAYTGFVMPELVAVKTGEGEITDVKIQYPMDLEAQMLRWSGRRK